ncbi:MAG: class I SAM-dependent methyltransferase [Myxococcaceae bacterium]
MKPALAVTVSGKQPGRWTDRAQAVARDAGVPFVRRETGSSLERLAQTAATALLVYGGDGWALHDAEGVLPWTPGMAQLRIKRLDRDGVGGDDYLLKVAELRPGDVVIDGTLGLGSDALVCAHRVGPRGRVIAVEASLPLCLLTREGLRDSELPAAEHIECHHARAIDFLRARASGSADCVIFDPMFEKPKKSSPAFAALRRFAVNDPLDEATLAEARRVARRWVVVKSGRYGKEIERLGLEPVVLPKEGPLVWSRIAGGA